MKENTMDKYQIFISYRREGGADLAGRIADQLKISGYKVFFDVETMRSGNFNTQLFKAIDQCSDVVVVLPPHALDRCRNKNDWVRQEIAYALKKGKNIVPIMMRGFKFPFFMPKDISDIKIMQGITASNDYFDAVIQKLERLLISKKSTSESKTNNPKNANLKNTYIDFIKSLTHLEFSNAKQYFEEGNDISIEGEIIPMCQQVLEKRSINKNVQKEFCELLLIFKTIYKLAVDKGQKEICQFMQSISIDDYIAACDDIKAYLSVEVDNLDCELTNTIFRYLSAYQNNPEQKSYWESLLKEIFRFMKLCEEFDKRTSNYIESNSYSNSSHTALKKETVKEKTIDEEKLIQGVYFGYRLGTLELIWGRKDDLGKDQFETLFKTLKIFLDADKVPYEESNYHQFCNSIINYYSINDSHKLYAILIGIFILRMSIYHDMDYLENKEMKESYYDLAVSALSTIPSSFIKEKEDFVNIIKQKLANGFELPDVIQEIYRYIIINCS